MNNRISQTKAKLEKQYFTLMTQYEQVMAEMLKRAYKGKPVGPDQEQEEQKKFLEAVDFEIKRLTEKCEKGLRAKSTIVKWETTRIKLKAFIQHKFPKADVSLEEL